MRCYIKTKLCSDCGGTTSIRCHSNSSVGIGVLVQSQTERYVEVQMFFSILLKFSTSNNYLPIPTTKNYESIIQLFPSKHNKYLECYLLFASKMRCVLIFRRNMIICAMMTPLISHSIDVLSVGLHNMNASGTL